LIPLQLPNLPSDFIHAAGKIPGALGPPRVRLDNNIAIEIGMESLVAGESRAE
jgi:hypothetical protein